MMFLSGCVSGAATSAICDGTADLTTEHAAALAVDGGPISQRTGADLIVTLDAACIA